MRKSFLIVAAFSLLGTAFAQDVETKEAEKEGYKFEVVKQK